MIHAIHLPLLSRCNAFVLLSFWSNYVKTYRTTAHGKKNLKSRRVLQLQVLRISAHWDSFLTGKRNSSLSQTEIHPAQDSSHSQTNWALRSVSSLSLNEIHYLRCFKCTAQRFVSSLSVTEIRHAKAPVLIRMALRFILHRIHLYHLFRFIISRTAPNRSSSGTSNMTN